MIQHRVEDHRLLTGAEAGEYVDRIAAAVQDVVNRPELPVAGGLWNGMGT